MMPAVRVYVRLIDGGASELQFGPELLEHLQRLQREGVQGKELIYSLLGDDWGAPPTDIRIVGETADGRRVDQRVWA